jgi:hypothetical protein
MPQKEGGLFGTKKEKESKPAKQPKPPKKPKEPKEKRPFFGKNKALPDEIMAGAAAVEGKVPQQVQSDYYPRDDVTVLEFEESGAPKFRYLGSDDLPRVIEINIPDRGVFTIGRFDKSIGVKQSNFEFDKRTKAVSRRHAAIERISDNYVIVDLNSSAGTFINGHKLSPNAPVKLERGVRVSFGHAGADYVWDE